MIKKTKEIKLARELRTKGWSIFKIHKELNVAKSSVSVWVRDIVLTEIQKKILKNNMNNTYLENLKGQSEINKNKYEEIRNSYRKDGYLLATNSEYFRTICLLYWAEGSKSRNKFCFCNSDMDMMKIVCDWIDKQKINKTVNFEIRYYGENGLNEYQIRRRWINKIQCLKNKKWKVRLLKQEIRRDSQLRGVGKLLYGTVAVSICSTELVQKIYGGINYIQENIGG